MPQRLATRSAAAETKPLFRTQPSSTTTERQTALLRDLDGNGHDRPWQLELRKGGPGPQLWWAGLTAACRSSGGSELAQDRFRDNVVKTSSQRVNESKWRANPLSLQGAAGRGRRHVCCRGHRRAEQAFLRSREQLVPPALLSPAQPAAQGQPLGSQQAARKALLLRVRQPAPQHGALFLSQRQSLPRTMVSARARAESSSQARDLSQTLTPLFHEGFRHPNIPPRWLCQPMLGLLAWLPSEPTDTADSPTSPPHPAASPKTAMGTAPQE